METKSKTKFLASSLVLIGLAAFADVASARTFGDMANDIVSGSFAGINNLITGGAYLLGVAFGVKAALKLKEHNESEGRVKLSTPLMLGVVSSCLLALPSFLKTGVETTMGSGAAMNTIQGARIQ